MKSPFTIFVGGEQEGAWLVVKLETVSGESLVQVRRVDVVEGKLSSVRQNFARSQRSVTSYGRFVNRTEKDLPASRQADLNRPEATCAALIPISKSAAWWELAQDEHRAIIETKSEHIKIDIRLVGADQ